MMVIDDYEAEAGADGEIQVQWLVASFLACGTKPTFFPGPWYPSTPWLERVPCTVSGLSECILLRLC